MSISMAQQKASNGSSSVLTKPQLFAAAPVFLEHVTAHISKAPSRRKELHVEHEVEHLLSTMASLENVERSAVLSTVLFLPGIAALDYTSYGLCPCFSFSAVGTQEGDLAHRSPVGGAVAVLLKEFATQVQWS
jgi:hypothetical protein